jgi:amidase
VKGLRIGVVEEGFDGAQADVRELVLAAVRRLSSLGAEVKHLSVPAHRAVRGAQRALEAEGALAVFKTGFFGSGARTYYPASFIAAINRFWANRADTLAPRGKLSLMLGELSRRSFDGRVYARAQNVRPTYIRAYDTALAEVDVLVMPTALDTAPRYTRPQGKLEILADALGAAAGPISQNTKPFNYTGHPALAVPIGNGVSGLPASLQLVGRYFDDPLLLRIAYAYEQAGQN